MQENNSYACVQPHQGIVQARLLTSQVSLQPRDASPQRRALLFSSLQPQERPLGRL
jgi:hypothetical protein